MSFPLDHSLSIQRLAQKIALMISGIMFGRIKSLPRLGSALFAMCALGFFGAVFMVPGGGIAYAQESGTETPPELRDFKFEPETPKPAPVPRPAPDGGQAVTPRPGRPATNNNVPTRNVPAATPDAASAPVRPSTQTPQTRQPSQTADRTRTPRNSAVPAADRQASAPPSGAPGDNQTAASQADPVETGTDPEAPVQAAPTTDTASQTDMTAASSSSFPYWQLALALALGGIALWWFFGMLRSRREAAARAERGLASAPAKPEPAATPAPMETAKPRARDTDGSAAAATAIPEFLQTEPEKATGRRPMLEASFTPAKATISLANLTIKGQLEINNVGSVIARNVNLRTDIISANAEQEAQISAFYAAMDAETKMLGDIAKGERLHIDIDLILPLHLLTTFVMEKRKLFAPIVLANIGYGWGVKDAQDDLHLSYMIGREATPPTPKMAPLRLDLGPRSISPLGHRSLLPG